MTAEKREEVCLLVLNFSPVDPDIRPRSNCSNYENTAAFHIVQTEFHSLNTEKKISCCLSVGVCTHDNMNLHFTHIICMVTSPIVLP